jgi:acyl dehydratase
MTKRYLEDFTVGQTFGSGRVRVDKDRIKTFAAEFDPKPFHLDEEAARDTIFRGLAASGSHTAALLTTRLLVKSEFKPAGGIVGAGFEELRWPLPVRPGDELRVESEVLEVTRSEGVRYVFGNSGTTELPLMDALIETPDRQRPKSSPRWSASPVPVRRQWRRWPRAAAITPLAGWPIFAWYARAALVMASSGNV